MRHPTISDVRAIGRRLMADGAVLLVFDRRRYAAASWGRTRAECADMAAFVDRLAAALESGAVRPPWEAE